MSNVPMHGKPILFVVLRDITERKSAEKAIQRQNAFLDALHGTTLALIHHLDSADLLKNIIERAGQLLNTKHGYLSLVDQTENVLEIKITIGVFQEYLGTKLRPGEGLAGRVWQDCCPMSVGHYEEWDERSAKINRSALGNLAAAPLTSGDTVIGVLGMAYPELDHDFDAETLETLNRFAQLVSVVLENARLHTAAQQETAERKRVEAERINLQEEIIQMQEKALIEMSTPLIPLSESVVVIPLIGTIDSRRSLQIKEALLQGIKQHKAKIALLDITGVPLVDEKVADSLVAIAQIARLLGTQVILTGIRPDVAMKFVQLGASLQGIITQNTLQSGISWALQQQTKPSGSSFSSNSRNRSFVR
jgi:anti-anti-sigma regulatory factor